MYDIKTFNAKQQQIKNTLTIILLCVGSHLPYDGRRPQSAPWRCDLTTPIHSAIVEYDYPTYAVVKGILPNGRGTRAKPRQTNQNHLSVKL